MSMPAEKYYKERARRLRIEHVPPVLSGRPCILWQSPVATAPAPARAGGELRNTICRRYDRILEDVGSFVLACVGKEPAKLGEQHPEGRRQMIEHVVELFGPDAVLPQPIEGRMHAVYVEAIPDYAITIAAA